MSVSDGARAGWVRGLMTFRAASSSL